MAFSLMHSQPNAFSFANRDTVPSTDSTGKDSSMAFNFSGTNRFVAFNLAQRDTVPSDTDTTKKDSSMAFQNSRKSGLATLTILDRNTVPDDSYAQRNALSALNKEAEEVYI